MDSERSSAKDREEREERQREREEKERERGAGILRESSLLTRVGICSLHRLMCVTATAHPESLYCPQIPIAAEVLLTCLPESDVFALLSSMIKR